MDEDRWDRLAALADPVRRRVYEHVELAAPVSRDQIATALGLGRSVVTHHLARLQDDGLLVAEPEPPTGRPGRPAVLYRPGAVPELPGRRYELLAHLLAASAGRPSPRLLKAARTTGAAAVPSKGSARQRALTAMAELGFAPQARPGRLEPTSCPFLAVSTELPEVVCSVARALAEGVAAEVDGWSAQPTEPPRCCVELVAS